MRVFKKLDEAIAKIIVDHPQNERLSESIGDLRLRGITKLGDTIYIVDEYDLLADVAYVLNDFPRNKLRAEYFLLRSELGPEDLDVIIGFDRYCEERKTASFSDMRQSLGDFKA